VTGHLHTPAALPPRKETTDPLDRRLGVPQSGSGGCDIITKFYSENLKERYHSERPRHGWEDNIRMDLREVG
jgi:hypothetical protein